MNPINEILKHSQPELYEKGTSVMWTDPHISKQLLQVHLSADTDLASRKPETIDRTVEWILEKAGPGPMKILDLGCGPGLYAERFASKGYSVTGVDFSENSIRYASEQAKKKNLDIRYVNASYLDMELEDHEFDLALLIFTDFGPLLPEERRILLKNVKQALKPGGTFILDFINDNDLESKLSPKTWEATGNGFWRPGPYVALSESILYPNEKVILYQHIILTDEGEPEIYRFWNGFFSNNDLGEYLSGAGFSELEFFNEVIPSSDIYKSGDITFCVCKSLE
jgi:ubiquinone/menaquinone biosynthesis C-methylase UbiE